MIPYGTMYAYMYIPLQASFAIAATILQLQYIYKASGQMEPLQRPLLAVVAGDIMSPGWPAAQDWQCDAVYHCNLIWLWCM